MTIELKEISKRYGFHRVIRNANYFFDRDIIYGIKGPNGSGKSTLVQMISGYLSSSQGEIRYKHSEVDILRDEVYRYISICAPYIDLIEDLTLKELFDLSSRFDAISAHIDWEIFLMISQLHEHGNKAVKLLSSGLKQRYKLSLSICSGSPVLILDEPTSYFDRQSKNWFYELLMKKAEDQKVILASNDSEDLSYCEEIVDVLEFK